MNSALSWSCLQWGFGGLGAFCVTFAGSPGVCRCSDFLPQSKGVKVRWCGNSKLSVGVNECSCWPRGRLTDRQPRTLNRRVKLSNVLPAHMYDRIYEKQFCSYEKSQCGRPHLVVVSFLSERWACFVVRLVPAWSYCWDQNRILGRNSQAYPSSELVWTHTALQGVCVCVYMC